MTSPALLAVAIPSYKRPEMLARLLDSIAAKLPIAVSDNGATLDAAFRQRYPHVRFAQQADVVTVLKNWNLAARAVDSEWIVMPGDDDLYYPSSFERIEAAIRRNPTADVFFFGHHIIDEHDAVLETWSPAAETLAPPRGFERVRLGTPARPPSIVFRRSMYESLEGFCEDFCVTAGDNDFYQRATLVGNVVFVPDVVSGYRVWSSGSTSQTIASRAWLDEIDLWCRRVQAFANDRTSYRYPDSLRDEIYLANLRAGVHARRRVHGWLAGWRHAAGARYPSRAAPMAQARLFIQLLLPRRPR